MRSAAPWRVGGPRQGLLSPFWPCEGEQLTEPEGEAEASWCGPPFWLGRPGTFTTPRPLPRKRLEEAPLVTKAFREAQMKEKLQRYPKVPGAGVRSPHGSALGPLAVPTAHRSLAMVSCTSAQAGRAAVC